MKNIKNFAIVFGILISLIFVSCKEETDEVKIDDSPIPSSGLYFKMKLGGDFMWRGNNFATMYAKTEPQESESKFIDFVVCTEDLSDNVATLRQYLILHVNVNDQGGFLDYNVMYFKNRGATENSVTFDKFMYYKEGNLVITKNQDGKISGRFIGKLVDVYDFEDIRAVTIQFQDFPISPAKK
ncbi:MAG: hypothetical protein H6Q15_1038 [Bacteroidetes bacterium]|nr:hypothetical protein [Bacteroidota bacterium]